MKHSRFYCGSVALAAARKVSCCFSCTFVCGSLSRVVVAVATFGPTGPLDWSVEVVNTDDPAERSSSSSWFGAACSLACSSRLSLRSLDSSSCSSSQRASCLLLSGCSSSSCGDHGSSVRFEPSGLPACFPWIRTCAPTATVTDSGCGSGSGSGSGCGSDSDDSSSRCGSG
jgi:hypothetical protein